LKLPVNRFDIADYLGTAPESAARAFTRLEAEGLVKRVTSRTVDILDLDRAARNAAGTAARPQSGGERRRVEH
jgi:Mn-dependent DtxR family transcriptional regulator